MAKQRCPCAAEADDVEAAILRQATQKELQSICSLPDLCASHRTATIQQEYELECFLLLLLLRRNWPKILQCFLVWIKHTEDTRTTRGIKRRLQPASRLKWCLQIDVQHNLLGRHAWQC